MKFNLRTLCIEDQYKRYEMIETPQYQYYFVGKGFVSGKFAGYESFWELVKKGEQVGELDYLHIYGAYRVIQVNRFDQTVSFFTDNAGICCFYYDEKLQIISDSFLELLEMRKERKPDIDSITDFIHFGCIYSNRTIVEGVYRTDAMNVYHYNQILNVVDKGFSLDDNDMPYCSLHDYMKDVKCSYKNEKILNVITGGMDSRTVLAHCISLGVDFHLGISGDEEMVDVQIARQICDLLDKKLLYTSENVEDYSGWIQDLFQATDGMTSPLGYYRLFRFYQKQQIEGFTLELGGACGEMYKNSFVNQDFPFLKNGNVNYNKFFKLKILPSKIDLVGFSEQIKQSASTLVERFRKNIFSEKQCNLKKAQVYFYAGVKILRARMSTLSNAKSFFCFSCNPLAEPFLYKLPYRIKPIKLELGRWQRNEVSFYGGKLLASIRTDRGVTCRRGWFALLCEMYISYWYLFKMAYKRLFKRSMLKMKEKEIYIKGFETEEFQDAIRTCKKVGILVDESVVGQMPITVKDRLFMIGMVFKYKQS